MLRMTIERDRRSPRSALRRCQAKAGRLVRRKGPATTTQLVDVQTARRTSQPTLRYHDFLRRCNCASRLELFSSFSRRLIKFLGVLRHCIIPLHVYLISRRREQEVSLYLCEVTYLPAPFGFRAKRREAGNSTEGHLDRASYIYEAFCLDTGARLGRWASGARYSFQHGVSYLEAQDLCL